MGSTVMAQPTWQWGKRGGSGNPATNGCCYETVKDMATDRNGNVYVLGTANMGINVDGHTHNGYGNNLSSGNLVLSSWNCNGNFRWMKVMGSYTNSFCQGIGVDTLGGVYLTGTTISNNSLGYTHVDSDTALGNTNKSMFLLKYDTSGVYQWMRMPQSDTVGAASISYTNSIGLAVAPNGNTYMLCRLEPGLYNGTLNVTTPAFYVLQYNRSGALVNAVVLDMQVTGGAGGGANLYNVQKSGFARDHNSGRFYLAGHYNSGYGSLTMGSTAITQASFLGSFNGSGTSAWVKQSSVTNPQFQSQGYISGKPVVDGQGNVYITGNAFHGQSWNGYTFTNSLTTLEWNCPFVAKMDANGNNLWVSGSSVIGSANGQAIALAGNEVGVTGNFYQKLKWGNTTVEQGFNEMSDVFLARLDAQTGSLLSIDTLVSTFGAEEWLTAMTADKRGNFYCGGEFYVDLTVAGTTLQSIGGESDWFVAKLGRANCNCTLPEANFTYQLVSAVEIKFTYTGSLPADSVVWDFGNGILTRGLTTNHTFAGTGIHTVCATAYNNCGSNTSCKAVETGVTGINEQETASAIKVYPNPVAGVLYIDGLAKEATAVLYNRIGQAVWKGPLKAGATQVNMQWQPAGMYILEVQTSAGQLQRWRITKQ